ncbi:MGMT family protein [Algoriphagus hitonicola]|uniref:Methylated-DNA-protein-cysteine methyltransferase related protein n=1 Tax=Algoriphagus hitonicola TaxID=435880 RepID=A0A1I2UTT8_9BACT|nr:MGMT family protein [Algoriphagus hitonicola]SFG80373.1 methylated-DNA-protein-cysteine methyltransferase related protein [Algoriphagus hitonicola]
MSNEKANYFDLVYQVVREIPPGRVCSYGAIANYLGLKSGARMVGYAMNAAHTLSDVPAHRVVNRQGRLTGKHHFETPTRMLELLEAEGVQIVNDQVQDFENRFWDPEKELGF